MKIVAPTPGFLARLDRNLPHAASFFPCPVAAPPWSRAGAGRAGTALMLATALAALALAPQGRASDSALIGNGGDLSDPGSWYSGVPTGSLALFGSFPTPPTSASIGTGLSVNGLVVYDLTANFTITASGSNALTLGSSGIDMTSDTNGNNDVIIESQVALGAAQSWNPAAGRTLTVSGTLSGAFALTII